MVLPAKGRFSTEFAMGAVAAADAERIAKHITDIIG
jgi:hypothetical protein